MKESTVEKDVVRFYEAFVSAPDARPPELDLALHELVLPLLRSRADEDAAMAAVEDGLIKQGFSPFYVEVGKRYVADVLKARVRFSKERSPLRGSRFVFDAANKSSALTFEQFVAGEYQRLQEGERSTSPAYADLVRPLYANKNALGDTDEEVSARVQEELRAAGASELEIEVAKLFAIDMLHGRALLGSGGAAAAREAFADVLSRYPLKVWMTVEEFEESGSLELQDLKVSLDAALVAALRKDSDATDAEVKAHLEETAALMLPNRPALVDLAGRYAESEMKKVRMERGRALGGIR